LGSPIGFAFLEAPKKQKHNPCALLLDLFFLKISKSTKKAKTQPLCPPIGFVFSESTKKAKTQPLYPPIGFAFWAFLLDLLF